MIQELAQRLISGDRRALARLITVVEREEPETLEVMRAVHPHTGRGYCIGVTGPPGAGKSTLVDQLTFLLRSGTEKGDSDSPKVSILAADPTSPFSGGAILADRVRMQRHYTDQGVFIRSMATRGSHGGLPRSTRRAVKLLDAYGSDLMIVETVGVGQAELDIMDVADTVVVVLVPESGDSMQAIKAGLMEIADVFVVNKADRPGADIMTKDISVMLTLDSTERDWAPPILATQAHTGVGLQELTTAIEEHRKGAKETGSLARRRRARRRNEFFQTIREQAEEQVVRLTDGDGRLTSLLEQVESDKVDPYTAALEALKNRSP
ncbi:MAG: methylmalonyl Co-A mutase-associated GTPase MeaB [Dehalococcoidia bacterium]